MMNKVVLTVAGSDSSGGAGIQADIKTMAAHGVYGMSVITAITAQNTTGVSEVRQVVPEMVKAQIDMVAADIRPDAVKIGMVYSEENVHIIAEAMERWQLQNVVIDPVMISTSGAELLEAKAKRSLIEELFPLADLVTPNFPELLAILGDKAEPGRHDKGWIERAAARLVSKYGSAFLIKGGHFGSDASDYLLCAGAEGEWLSSERIITDHTHGTGCTLSSAIACNLANGMEPAAAVRVAKEYLTGCIIYHPGFGAGRGPVNHGWRQE